jgi:solute:Na+ symporter, SSS family
MSSTKPITYAFGAAFVLAALARSGTVPEVSAAPPPHFSVQAAKMLDVLKQAFAEEKDFVRIHAAEALVEHGEGKLVVATLGPEADSAPPIVRVGIWRTLAAAESSERRAKWVAKLREVMLTPGLPDRIHAAESLAKLGVSLPDDRPAIEELARTSSKAHSCHAIWMLALAGDEGAENRLVELLTSDDQIARLASGYILGRLPKISDESRKKLFVAARAEPTDSPACGYLLASAYLRAADAEAAAEFKTRLAERLKNGTVSERYVAALAIGERGDTADLPVLAPLLEQTGDARIGAAQGSLRILRRSQSP